MNNTFIVFYQGMYAGDESCVVKGKDDYPMYFDSVEQAQAWINETVEIGYREAYEIKPQHSGSKSIQFEHSWTWADWEFGFGIGWPTQGKFPLYGYIVKHPLYLHLFLGPLSISVSFGGREYIY